MVELNVWQAIIVAVLAYIAAGETGGVVVRGGEGGWSNVRRGAGRRACGARRRRADGGGERVESVSEGEGGVKVVVVGVGEDTHRAFYRG